LKGEIFNLGAGNARSLKELVDIARAHVASKSEVKWDPSRMLSYDAGCQEANMEKTFGAFTWRPTHNLEAGVTRMSEWCKSLLS
jgi:nucleoside-diphosphate-sugar epimerase